jgi:hypothetical protein
MCRSDRVQCIVAEECALESWALGAREFRFDGANGRRMIDPRTTGEVSDGIPT